METIVLTVTGMTCGGCVASVERVLTALPGVAHVDVKLEPGEARVVYDAARVAPETLVQAVVGAGFGASA